MSFKAVLLALVLSLAAVTARAQDSIQFVERTALGGKVALMAPASFGPMPAQMIRYKYPTENAPTEVLTDPTTAVNIAFGHTAAVISPAQLRQTHASIEQQIRTAQPATRWNRSEVVRRGDREVAVFDYWSRMSSGEVRNIMVAASVDGRLLVVSFNVAADLEKEWGAIGERIMNSIRVIE